MIVGLISPRPAPKYVCVRLFDKILTGTKPPTSLEEPTRTRWLISNPPESAEVPIGLCAPAKLFSDQHAA